MSAIIGRAKQIAEIQRLYGSGKAELLAVYGRRRIGKTFLVDESLKGKITFRHAGLSPIEKGSKKVGLKEQLKHFHISLKLHGYQGKQAPKSWLDAFYMLEELLQQKDNGERQVVFLDELPWLDTQRSGFLTAFEGFWNTWGCHRDNLMLVVCGSANSWILDNLIDSHGGLYGRTTYEIRLSPFTLGECREFHQSRGIEMSDYDTVQSYMALGGIPYYLGYIERDLSIAQNIDQLFWSRDARLRNEFDRLFESAFDAPDVIKKIVKKLATRHRGFTRKEIVEAGIAPDCGQLSRRLKALVASDFVTEYVPFGCGKKDLHYKLSDPFCLFYLHFVADTPAKEGYWLSHLDAQSTISWRGLAFEDVCFQHIPQIKAAIGISDVDTDESAWAVKGTPDEKGAQIDLLIVRKDNVVNMCEMKFYSDEFTVDKDYDLTIRHRQRLLSEQLPKKFSVHPTLISTFGIRHGAYSTVFLKQLTISDLFR